MITPVINAANTFRCLSKDDTEYPIHTMICNSAGFLGAYDPDPTSILGLINVNLKSGVNLTGEAAVDGSSNINNYIGRRRLLTTGTFNGTTFEGVKNPVVCLEYGELMLFAVDNTNYPIYDM